MGVTDGRETPLSPTDVDGKNIKKGKMLLKIFFICTDNLVKRLLPLGFTKASIRKELYYHDNDPDATALKLLSQQESTASSDTLDGGDKEGKNKNKQFTMRSIQV